MSPFSACEWGGGKSIKGGAGKMKTVSDVVRDGIIGIWITVEGQLGVGPNAVWLAPMEGSPELKSDSIWVGDALFLKRLLERLPGEMRLGGRYILAGPARVEGVIRASSMPEFALAFGEVKDCWLGGLGDWRQARLDLPPDPHREYPDFAAPSDLEE